MNVVTVKINGLEYNLKGEEKEEYLQMLAGYVDKKIKSILDNNSKLNLSSAAVLTAVNAVDDLFKCDMAYKDLCVEIEEAEKKEKDLGEENECLKKQVEELQRTNEELIFKINNDNSEGLLSSKEEELAAMKEEMEHWKEISEKYLKDATAYKTENKELKFQLQSARYKIIDLQNKLVENQINLVKVKKMNNPLINNDK